MPGAILRGRLAWVAMAGTILVAAVAAAQQPSPAGAAVDVRRLTTDVFGGWDASVRSNRGVFADPAQDSAKYGGADLSLAYSRPLSRRSRTLSRTVFGVSLSSSTRYIPQAATAWLPFHGLNLRLGSIAGGSRWSWGLSQGLSYGYRQATSLFAQSGLDVSSLAYGVPSGAADYQFAAARDLASDSAADVAFEFTRKDRLTLNAGIETVSTLNGERARYLRPYGGGGYTRQITQYLGLNAGYHYAESRSLRRVGVEAPERSFRLHEFDLGVNYARPLPFSRNTTVLVNTGAAGAPRGNGERYYTFVGTAGLAHQFKRTWAAQLNGERAIRFVPAFPDPTLVNAVSASIGGVWGRRTTMLLSGNYSKGQSGFGQEPTRFEAYSARLRLNYALFERAGLYTEYFYFLASVRSQFAQSEFPIGEFARHGVRIGATLGTDLGRRRR